MGLGSVHGQTPPVELAASAAGERRPGQRHAASVAGWTKLWSRDHAARARAHSLVSDLAWLAPVLLCRGPAAMQHA
jgi:hypothetical protein